eukprot:s2135_g28.t1
MEVYIQEISAFSFLAAIPEHIRPKVYALCEFFPLAVKGADENTEIYGGYNGFFDYGPLGAELKNNLKRMWWRRMVHMKDDVIGLDSSIVTTPSVHQASGHVDNFSDPMVDCTESKKRFRADQLLWAKVELEDEPRLFFSTDGTVLGYVSMVEDGDVEKAMGKAAKKLAKDVAPCGSGWLSLSPYDFARVTYQEYPCVSYV